jgi:hypothetical protein
VADSPLKTDLGIALELDEANGTRQSSYASGSATEVGGTIGTVAGVDSRDAVHFIRNDGCHLAVAHAAAIALGKRDWTIDGYLRLDVTNVSLSILQKGTEVHAYWASFGPQNHFAFSLDNGGLVFDNIVVNLAGITYLRIEHDWAAHTVTVVIGAYTSTQDYTWATDAGTSDAVLGVGDFGYWEGLLANFAMWSKVLSTGEKYLRANGVKYISSWSTNPPYIAHNRSWIQTEQGEGGAFTPTNHGGAVTAGGWDFAAGSDEPTGFAVDPDTGELSIDGTATQATRHIILEATNADGTSEWDCATVRVQTLYPRRHYDFDDYRKINVPDTLGVFAAKKGGITSVSFVVAGGAPVVVTDRTVNTRHGWMNYNIPFDPADHADGPVTIVATVTPVLGAPYVMPTFHVVANDGGTQSVVRYIDHVAGNDTTGDGLTPGTAWKTAIKALVATGDCSTLEVEMMDGGYAYSGSGSWSCPNGRVIFRPYAGQEAVQFVSSDAANPFRATNLKITIEDIYCDNFTFEANPADNPSLTLQGHTVWHGNGRADNVNTATIPATRATYSGGLYTLGTAVTPSLYADLDGDGEHWANESGAWVVFEDTLVGFYDFDLALNTIWRRIGAQPVSTSGRLCAVGVKCDRVDATGTNDGTGNELHNDAIQITPISGGDMNIYTDGWEVMDCKSQAIFSRNGAAPEDIPDTGYFFGSFLAHQISGGLVHNFQRPMMDVVILHHTLPEGSIQIVHNASDYGDRAIKCSHVEIRGCTANFWNLNDLGIDGASDDIDEIVLDENDSIAGGFDDRQTNSTSGGDLEDRFAGPGDSPPNYYPAEGGLLEGRLARLDDEQLDAHALGRAATTAVGALRAGSEGSAPNPPVIPATGSYTTDPGEELEIDFAAQNSGGAITSASILETPGRKPSGSAIDNDGLFTWAGT